VVLDVDAEAKGEESDHQSRPLKDPPNPTVPMREKSTCGNVDGAGVDAMAESSNGKRKKGEGRLSDMASGRPDVR
jgi:hypothetical protein